MEVGWASDACCGGGGDGGGDWLGAEMPHNLRTVQVS